MGFNSGFKGLNVSSGFLNKFVWNIFHSKKNWTWIDEGNNGSERDAWHHWHHTEEKTTLLWPSQKDARGENTENNHGIDTKGKKGKRTPKENVDGRSTSSHEKKFRIRPMEKQRWKAFGFWKTATAVNTLRTGSFKLFKRPFPGYLTILTL